MIKRDSGPQTRSEIFGSENYSGKKIFWPVMAVQVQVLFPVHSERVTNRVALIFFNLRNALY